MTASTGGVGLDSLPPEARRALFATAFWMASADELLKPPEQEWFEDQFGTDESRLLLGEFAAMDPDTVAAEAHALPGLLPDEEQGRVLKGLRPWLLSLAHADSFFAVRERMELVEILRSLGLRVRSPLFVVKGSTPAWHAPRPHPSRMKTALWWLFACATVFLFIVTAVTWLIRNPITFAAAALCTVLVMLMMILDLDS